MDQRTREAEPIRVILAEDHALVREGTRRILEATDNIVVVAEAADGVLRPVAPFVPGGAGQATAAPSPQWS